MNNLFESNKDSVKVEKVQDDLPFVDITIVNEVDTRENFIIRCEDKEQMFFLQKYFKTKAKKIEFEKICQLLKQ